MANILLAEDHEATRTLFVHALRSGGHRVAVASDGMALQARLETGQFDLLLTDLNMSKGGAGPSLRFVRENLPGLPVIVCTASDGMDPGEARGDVRVLHKPVSLTALKAAIGEMHGEPAARAHGAATTPAR